eukprot:TRINITY_DN5686_c0_g1_i1.p1 TRINITY_DN5686_c0_g1~~TRINITY_DN5686_c0_g1_i1.p1  ORF type:complete len:197 (-),score=60.75 TRINITY_DN5686_c0_g1_i1:643-1212(-)
MHPMASPRPLDPRRDAPPLRRPPPPVLLRGGGGGGSAAPPDGGAPRDPRAHPSHYPEMYWVRVGKSPLHGRGVFAVRDLPANTIVEVCPTLTLDKEACVHQKCILMDYLFESEEGDHMVIAMGYGMMYNSAKNPNVLHYFDIDGNMVFVAKRDIVKGEELFHYYGEEWWYTRKGRPEPQLQPPTDVIEL